MFNNTIPMLFPVSLPSNKVNIFGDNISGLIQETRKIILPEMYNEPLTRSEIIDKFLRNGWVPKKDEENIKKWLAKMLDGFSLELLLHAKHGGLDRLLMNTKTVESRKDRRFEVLGKVTRPKKLRVYEVEVEEIEGDLDSQVKTIKVKDVPNDVATNEDCH